MQKWGSKKERLADPIFINFWSILELFLVQIPFKIASGPRSEKTLIFKFYFLFPVIDFKSPEILQIKGHLRNIKEH